MSRFPCDPYRFWLRKSPQVGSSEPSGGMGGMPPMVTLALDSEQSNSREALAANDESYSRPDKRMLNYVDNIIKDPPTSFFILE